MASSNLFFKKKHTHLNNINSLFSTLCKQLFEIGSRPHTTINQFPGPQVESTCGGFAFLFSTWFSEASFGQFAGRTQGQIPRRFRNRTAGLILMNSECSVNRRTARNRARQSSNTPLKFRDVRVSARRKSWQCPFAKFMRTAPVSVESLLNFLPGAS